jgi:hypothetical protein
MNWKGCSTNLRTNEGKETRKEYKEAEEDLKVGAGKGSIC